ncbi:MAG TPA: hypothetical protein VFH45_05885 [Acidimicrobiales bacterium]|nr:hypothetical protein [Acidimicrobiales bacterium]
MLTVLRPDGSRVQAGDTAATRKIERTQSDAVGGSVRNRQTWKVTQIRPDGGLLVADSRRGQVLLPADYVSRHVELGWAVTGYGNQGVTVDHGICILEASTSRAGVYVAMTRGRSTNTAFVPDQTGITDPAEVLAGVIRRPHNGLTAHAARDRISASHHHSTVDDGQHWMERVRQVDQTPPPVRRRIRR